MVNSVLLVRFANSDSNSIGYLVAPSTSSSYLLLCDARNKDLSFCENSLVFVRYQVRTVDGHLIPVETLCYTGAVKLENPYNQTVLSRVILSNFGNEMNDDGDGDQKYIEVFPIAAINLNTGEPIAIGVPPSQSRFYFVNNDQLENYYRSQRTTFKFGYLSGTDVAIGLDIRHFGSGDKGWGDARMMGIAGRTGSGKTVLVGSLISAYATHQQMGILIVDPQGQFSSTDSSGRYTGELGKNPNIWSWKLGLALAKAGRSQDISLISASQVNFGNDLDTFIFLLSKYKFWEAIKPGIKRDKVTIAETDLIAYLENCLQSTNLAQLKWSNALFDTVVDLIANTYRSPDAERDFMLHREMNPNPPSKKAGNLWNYILSFFDPQQHPYSMEKIVADVLIGRKIVIFNADNLDEDIKDLYYLKLFSSLKVKAQRIYHQALASGTQSDVNALLVLDEAQRIIPEYAESDMKVQILTVIRDAINTSRKLGIGWIFATQSVTNIDKRIWAQLGTKFIGYGFGTGADKECLLEICGRDTAVLNRYMRMPMPLQTGKYWFMVQGELIGVGNGNQCLFIDAFPSQSSLFDFNSYLFNTAIDPVS